MADMARDRQYGVAVQAAIEMGIGPIGREYAQQEQAERPHVAKYRRFALI